MDANLPPIVVELLRLLGSLMAAVVGGGLVILANWMTDRRRQRREDDQRDQRERTLLTGMFAVRNHIVQRLNAFDQHRRPSELERLRTAQSYVRRFVEEAPDGSERLMISVLEIGLKLDALLSTIERLSGKPRRSVVQALMPIIIDEVNELLGALEQFDVMSGGALMHVTDEDLKRMGATDEMLAALDPDRERPDA